MPSAEQILESLSTIANQFMLLAAAWHLLLLVLLLAVARGFRPSPHVASLVLALPLGCVSALAWAKGNPFNGAMFAGLGIALLWVSRGLPRDPARGGPPWALFVGMLTLAYAWVYPHFLEPAHPALRLIASPMGLLPCPTLSMVIGLGLLGGGLSSRAFSLTTGLAGAFYALFGMLRLGVWLDLGLLLASAAILVFARRTELVRAPGASQHKSSRDVGPWPANGTSDPG